MPQILDVAIGTLFVFLIFSLVVSALNEWLLSMFDQRAKFLRLGLAEIFQKADTQPAISGLSALLGNFLVSKVTLSATGEKFLSHGLLNAFSRSDNGGTSPSYLPGGAFVTGLLDLVTQDLPVASTPPAIGEVTLVAKLVSDLKAPRATAPIADNTYLAPLEAFAAGYDALVPPAAPDSEASRLNQLVAVALSRQVSSATLDATRDALQAAADTVVALTMIPAERSKRLFTLMAQASDVNEFRQRLANWNAARPAVVDYAHELDTLLVASVSALARMGQPFVRYTAANIDAAIRALPENSKLRESLLSLFNSVSGDVEKFKVAVEGWYNGVMDRVSGWYKRFAQKWMIALGFILAAVFNVDSIEVVRVLSNNPNLAKAVAEQTGVYVSTAGKPKTSDELSEQRMLKKKALEEAELALAEAEREGKAKAELDKLRDAVGTAKADIVSLDDYRKAVAKLAETGIPFGWTPDVWTKLGFAPRDSAGRSAACPSGSCLRFDVLLAITLGWFFTAIAASVGAPFWFDILGRVINIRNAGKSPDDTNATGEPKAGSLQTTP